MRYALISILCLLMTVSIIAQETDEPPVGVIQSTDAVTDGYVMFSPSSSSIVYLLDNEGMIVHQWQAETRITHAYLLENGDLLALMRLANDAPFPAGGTGRVQRLSWDGDVLWQYDVNSPDVQIHHDIALKPDGNILMLMWERIDPDQFAAYGIDPAVMPEASSVYYDIIIEVDPAINEIVWQWRTLDHSIQTINPDLDNYGIPAARPDLLDINYTHRENRTQDRTHFNAIDYHPDLDQILISAHYQSEIWIVDRSRNELVYRWGNPAVYGRGLPENRQTFNQHHPTWLENDNILIFNNGQGDIRSYSSVIEIEPPLREDGTYDILDGAAFPPFEPVWDYAPRDADEFFSRNISGAHRLSNGNTFITDGANGRLLEIDAQGMIVWEYINPVWFSPDDPRPSSIFRATRYAADYPGLADRDLTPTVLLDYQLDDSAARQNRGE